MDFKDYYKILGVSRNADDAAIKQAYRKLARKYHPDRNTEAGAAERMSEINEANTVLSDPEKRAAYDALGPDGLQGGGFQPPPGWQYRSSGSAGEGMSGEQFSDFFSSLFGQGAGRGGFRFDDMAGAQFGGAGGRARSIRGDDAEARLEIDLADAFRGASKTLSLAGAQGTGEPRTLEVKIPQGIKAGQKIRLAGYGHPGRGGGAAGDLLLEVAFRPDARYQVHGADVTQQVPVAPWEAALGGEIEVQTLSGDLSVKVPAGSQSGRKLRLKGRGLPAKTPGDYFLELQVVLPPADSDKAREIYTRMAQELAFNPRG